MSARACLSPFERSSNRAPEGCPVWTYGVCSDSLLTADYEHRLAARHPHGLPCSMCGRISCWPEMCPMFHTLSSGKHGHSSLHLHSAATECRHPAAGCVHTARSWVLLHHCNVHAAARGLLTNTWSRVCGTDNPNFYYSTRHAAVGPKIRPVLEQHRAVIHLHYNI